MPVCFNVSDDLEQDLHWKIQKRTVLRCNWPAFKYTIKCQWRLLESIRKWVCEVHVPQFDRQRPLLQPSVGQSSSNHGY
jgi:hypothetical protein